MIHPSGVGTSSNGLSGWGVFTHLCPLTGNTVIPYGKWHPARSCEMGFH